MPSNVTLILRFRTFITRTSREPHVIRGGKKNVVFLKDVRSK